MASEVLTLISTFKDPIIKKLKDIRDKVTFFFEVGLYDYLLVHEEKYRYSKTFLFRDEQVNFYDTYYPISLTTPSGKETYNTAENCLELFKVLSHNKNCVMIIGTAGSGKSMLMKHFFLECINQAYKVPIFIELRTFNNYRGNMLEFITQILFSNKIVPYESLTILRRILAEGKFLFLFDGFDEIYSEHKIKILEDLNNFIDQYSNNQYVMTSRPGTDVESFSRFNNFYVSDLNENEVMDFIRLQLKNVDDKSLAEQIISKVQAPENLEYLHYLKSPLLLSMFLLTYNCYPELPKNKSTFYSNVVDTLLTRHDSIKMPGYQHERVSKLLNEEIEKLLKWFSYISFFEGQFAFSKKYLQEKFARLSEKLKIKIDIDSVTYDLSVSVAIFVKDGVEYRFPHRTLQEFFAAVLISEQKGDINNKIYAEKFDLLEKKSTSDNVNFLNLCIELDQDSLYKHWAIPKLEKYITQTFFYSSDGKLDYKNTICSFLDNMSGQITVNGRKSVEKITFSKPAFNPFISKLFRVLRITEDEVLKGVILSLNELASSIPVKQFFEDLINEKVLPKDGYQHDTYSFVFHKLWNSNLYKVIESSMIVAFGDFVSNLKDEIKKLNLKIDESEKIAVDLLDL